MLLERKQELDAQIEDHFGTQYELIKESMGDLSSYDNHPGDQGTELYEREKDIALNDHAEEEVKDINKALQAIEAGTFGKCEVCGTDIDKDRMLAMPTSLRCIEHADHRISRDRPAEEDVIHPSVNEMESSVDEEESTIFDAEDSWQRVSAWGSSEGPSDFYDTEKDFDNMFFNSDELVGSAEEVEGFILTDMHGNYIGVNEDHEKYEDYLDENQVSSILYE